MAGTCERERDRALIRSVCEFAAELALAAELANRNCETKLVDLPRVSFSQRVSYVAFWITQVVRSGSRQPSQTCSLFSQVSGLLEASVDAKRPHETNEVLTSRARYTKTLSPPSAALSCRTYAATCRLMSQFQDLKVHFCRPHTKCPSERIHAQVVATPWRPCDELASEPDWSHFSFSFVAASR